MKANARRSIEAAVLLLGGLGAVSSAPAAIINGALGAGALATDKYDFLCPAGTASARGRVEDLAGIVAPLVSLQINDVGATNVTDPVDADGVPSGLAVLVNGPGNYELLVDKTGFGAENYQIVVNCFNAAGAFISAGFVVQTQNQ